jgi:dsDNA-specific endonuclease/ATPase MutS2
MPKLHKREAVTVESLGSLAGYDEGELVQLREKLIDNERRIHQESAHLAKRLKEINQARNELQHQLAENARSMRAVKHALGQRSRPEFALHVPMRAARRR